jgi:mannose-6-phosphate isomerase-like protein (cupin superfamily)
MNCVIDIADGREFLALGAPVRRLVHPMTTGSREIGVSICLMPPGSRIKLHRHDYEEAYFVVAGRGLMYLEGVGEIELMPDRSVYIPSNMIHGQSNTSQSEDLKIVCSLSPPPVEGDVPEMFE